MHFCKIFENSKINLRPLLKKTVGSSDQLLQSHTWATSIQFAMIVDLGVEACMRTVEITLNETALNWVTVANTVGASSARLFSRRDQTPPKH